MMMINDVVGDDDDAGCSDLLCVSEVLGYKNPIVRQLRFNV